MASADNLTPEQLKQLELAEKLFRTAGRSPAEAEQYTARAMAILEALNMDMSVLEQGGAEKAKRSDEKMAGGLYKWQRDLWQSIAELHFCFYWNQYVFDPDKVSAYAKRKYGAKAAREYGEGGYTFQHRVVGRTVNVVAVRNMAGYLEQTIERLTREHVGVGSNFYTNYATSFRQGVAEEVVGKIWARRREMLSAERRKEREAEERAQQAGMANASTSRAVTLASVAKQEEEANYDFLNGEGAYARRREDRAKRAREAKEAEEAYTAWAKANPEEARVQEEERLKANRRRTSWNAGMGGGERDNRDWSAFKAGRRAGGRVSIDPQAESRGGGAGIGRG